MVTFQTSSVHWSDSVSQLITIDLTAADARERGRQYGEAAREQIARSVAFYAESVARATGLPWQEILDRAPAWVPVIDGYLPDILDELRGIA